MKVLMKIDPERITVDDLIAIEEGITKTRAARDLLARFVTDESGNFLEEAEAKAFIGKLNVSNLAQLATELQASVKELQNKLVPPANATS